MLARFLTWLKLFFVQGDPLARALSSLSFTIGLATLLSIGPELQHYLVALITSQATSIYASAYDDTLVRYPDVKLWVSSASYWPFPVMALVISVFSLRQKTIRSIFRSAVAWSFIAWMTTDICYELAAGAVTTSTLLQNTIFNLVGAGAIAVWIVVTLVICEFLYAHAPGGQIFRRTTALLFPAFFGIILCFLSYYVLSLFYDPVPEKVAIFLEAPITGAFVPSDGPHRSATSASKSEKPKPFSLFPSKANNGVMGWVGDGTTLRSRWTAPKTKEIYDIAISFYDGCIGSLPLSVIVPPAGRVQFKDVRSIEATFDKGIVDFETFPETLRDFRMSLEASGSTPFWVTKDDDSKKIKVQQFVSGGAEVQIWHTISRTLSVYISEALFEPGHPYPLSPTAHVIHLRINDVEHLVRFDAPNISTTSSCACEAIGSIGGIDSNVLEVIPKSLWGGVLVEISARPEANVFYDSAESIFHISGGTGWASLSGLTDGDLADLTEKGFASLVQFSGTVSEMTVDDVKYVTHPSETYSLSDGIFLGSFDPNGRLSFVGKAKSIFKDEARVNKTRWESMDWPERSLLLAGFPGLLLFVLTAAVHHIRADRGVRFLKKGRSSGR